MRYLGGFLVGFLGVLGLVASAVGQTSVQWHPDFEGAKAVAAQRGQLVLAYFWAPWCPMCLQMEREVFSQPGLAAAVHSAYVPVKVNHDEAPQLIRSYGVQALPATVLISPDGTPLDRIEGRMPARQLSARLQRVAHQVQKPPMGPPPVVARNAPPVAGAPLAVTGPPVAGAPPAANGPPAPNGPPAANGLPSSKTPPVANGPPAGNVPPTAGVARTPSVRPNPPLALDGYCAVSLTDDLFAGQRRWVLGNRAHGVIHRGRTYLFADGEKAARFFQEPDRYAPVLSGQDVVVAVEEGRAATGRREHGAFFGNRVYLFANEETLQRFENNPNRYADAIVRLSSRQGPSW